MRVSGGKSQRSGTERRKRRTEISPKCACKRLEKSIGEVCCERRLDLGRAGDGAAE